MVEIVWRLSKFLYTEMILDLRNVILLRIWKQIDDWIFCRRFSLHISRDHCKYSTVCLNLWLFLFFMLPLLVVTWPEDEGSQSEGLYWLHACIDCIELIYHGYGSSLSCRYGISYLLYIQSSWSHRWDGSLDLDSKRIQKSVSVR